jgi:serine acetyltransferase
VPQPVLQGAAMTHFDAATAAAAFTLGWMTQLQLWLPHTSRTCALRPQQQRLLLALTVQIPPTVMAAALVLHHDLGAVPVAAPAVVVAAAAVG